MTEPSPTRVGVLLVHGIGEQRRFQHLEGEVRNIATALAADGGNVESVRVEVRTTADAAYGAEQPTWRAEEVAPVMVEIAEKGSADTPGDVTQIEFREVWWADLDEPATLPARIKFWCWVLSMWTICPKMGSRLAGFTKHMRLPASATVQGNGVGVWGRTRLFVVAAIFLLILLTISVLNLLLRRVLGVHIPGPEILVRYIGDVKLFQQDHRIGKGPLVDIGQPPRVTLRRRMIRALAHMALAKYERWYVLAHSQGTVLSFNGLMETQHALPNYLDEALWRRCQEAGIGSTVKTPAEALTEEEAKNMMPRRPAWLEPVDVIDRERLFERLDGYLTYGSPLEKFATLFPAIVPLNKDEAVFNDKFKWFNVFDATDPVSGAVKSFGPSNAGPDPVNISYKANGVHLWSHIRYLAFGQGTTPRLVDVVGRWIWTGGFDRPANDTWRWPSDGGSALYGLLRIIIWLALGWFLAAFLVWATGKVLPSIYKAMEFDQIVETSQLPSWFADILSRLAEMLFAIVENVAASPLAFVFFAIGVVGLAGLIRLAAGCRRN